MANRMSLCIAIGAVLGAVGALVIPGLDVGFGIAIGVAIGIAFSVEQPERWRRGQRSGSKDEADN